MTVRRKAVLWVAYARWLGALFLLGAAYSRSIQGASSLLAVQVAAAVAAGTSLAFGCLLGYRRDWPRVATAPVIGMVVLVGWAESARVASLSVPAPGGASGFLEILAPFFIAIFVGPLAVVVLAALLGSGALATLAIRKRSMLVRVAVHGRRWRWPAGPEEPRTFMP
jgi:hypothetical protein